MNVKWFVLGIVAVLIAIFVAGYIYVEQGFVSARADVKPGVMDSWLGSAMDASTKRHAPKTMNPVSDTEATLVSAAQVYGSRCGVCHGTPSDHDSKLGKAFYPP
ncbi:MAG: hypothetical protein ACRD4F_00485, partial [Candidatus Angelobacter sp.]